MIALFTDFGWNGPYVGQMHAVLAEGPVPVEVIDLMHDAPQYDPRAAGHLLAALVPRMPAGTVFVAVVDPGVGTDRRGIVVEVDGYWFVGPDNGLLDVVTARAPEPGWWRIERSPSTDSATFHGRDLFAPVAAAIARGEVVPGEPVEAAPAASAADELGEVIYIDDYGNACTGLHPPPSDEAPLSVSGRELPRACTFADVAPGEPMWLVNSIGLVEIAVNQGDAADELSLDIGSPVRWKSA
ncbi:MAG: SAM-dependent chlorinase/fluorinase [Halofilum sp. (in: g-proteobacteria)]|nr:SAM-dependent chlorinase/fluorinase [Halofilum sp. (in: g-proteobacteria)]